MHVCSCSLCSFSKQLFSYPLTALVQGRTPLASHWGLGAAGAASPYLPQALPQNKQLPAWQGMVLELQGVRQEGVLSWGRKACPLGHPRGPQGPSGHRLYGGTCRSCVSLQLPEQTYDLIYLPPGEEQVQTQDNLVHACCR